MTFAPGATLTQTARLLKIVVRCGRDPQEAHRVLTRQRHVAKLDQLRQQALTLGIRALPTLRCEGRELVDFLDLAVCRHLMTG